MSYFSAKDFVNPKGEKIGRRRQKKYPEPGRYLVELVHDPKIIMSNRKGRNFAANLVVRSVLRQEPQSLMAGDEFSYVPKNKFPDYWMRSVLEFVGTALKQAGEIEGDLFDLETEEQQTILDSACVDTDGATAEISTVGVILDMEVVAKQKEIVKDGVTKVIRWNDTYFNIPDASLVAALKD